MKVDILTREYPPHVYGGAGVHAEELSKVLAERIDVTVRAFDGRAPPETFRPLPEPIRKARLTWWAMTFRPS